MERRAFAKVAVASPATALVAPSAVSGQAQVKWRLASSWPKSLDTIYGAADVIAKRVAAATAGRFQIRVFAPGEIVPHSKSPTRCNKARWNVLTPPRCSSSARIRPLRSMDKFHSA